jgi:hypothetical protein
MHEQTKSVAFSPQTNYTDRSKAASGEAVPIFAGRRCCLVGSLRTYSFKKLLSYCHEAELIPFQTLYLSENLLSSGIETETFEFVARNSNHRGRENARRTYNNLRQKQ